MANAAWRDIRAYLLFFALFAGILAASHITVLDLPYFWDELGQFIPAALDIREHGWWVPKSTTPNVHPPGVMAYLAGVWSVTGYSVEATRAAMLLLAAAGVLGTFLLSIELCRPLAGAPALFAPALLLASPLFWSQSMMAQLDMPAMVVTVFALLLFLRERFTACAIVCTALVLVKETSLVIPGVFGVWLLCERRVRPALLFFLPAFALAVWLLVLYRHTGHIFGNREFTHYNVWFQLHPVRLSLTVIRRFFYIFVDNFHWVGTIALVSAWSRTSIFRSRAWALVAGVAAAQTFAVSALGGAALERYILPVLPLFYCAIAAAWSSISPAYRKLSAPAMLAGLVAGIFVSSPFPYPFENNAAFVNFVRLQQKAAQFVSTEFPDRTIASAWPFPDALRRKEFGYVDKPLRVRGLDNFDPSTVLALKDHVDVLVVYSRTWEPAWGVIASGPVRRFLAEYYYYSPQITSDQIRKELHLERVARWDQGGQWIEVYVRPAAANTLIL